MIQLLYSLIYASTEHVSILARTLGAAITAAALVLFFAPWFVRLLKAKGYCEPSRDFGSLAASGKAGTPTLGGILIYLVVLATAILWCKFSTSFTFIPLIAGVGFGTIGLMDDLRKIRGKSSEAGISRRAKYAGQIVMGAMVAFFFLHPFFSPISSTATRESLYLPLWHGGLCLGLGYAAVILVFMVAASNSVNLTDGMDGLAIMPTILVALVLGAMGYITGRVDFAEYFQFFPGIDPATHRMAYGLKEAGELMVLGAAVAGAGVGFLWFNAHPATIFMGDTGSMALGGMLGSMAVLSKQEVLFFIAGGLFVLECASSFIQDYIGLKILGRRIFFRAPLHHNMLHNGIAETKVTVRLWILSVFFAVLALCTLKLR